MVMEHAIPLVAGGATDIHNLCLACYRCNEFKGAHTHGRDPMSDTNVPLFNPCKQAWRDHFVWSKAGLHVIGLSASGRATIEALHLNNEWLVHARRIWL